VSGQPSTADREAESRARDIALQHYINGSIHEMKGEYAEAILEYQDALRYDPNEAVYFALSKDYSALNRHTLAIESGRKAVGLAPGNLEYRRNLADVYIRAYELDSAAAQFEEIVRRDSSNIAPWYNLARLYQGRKPLKALEVYQEITRRFGPEWEVLLQIAELHNTLQQFDEAAGSLQKMLELDPGNVELKRTLAQTYVREKEYDKAIVVYRELREVQPDNLEYLSEMASVYLMKKEYEEAADLFEVVLAQDTVSVESKLRIGEVYFGQLENDSTLVPVARSIFERIRDAHPQDWRAYWFLGAIGAVSRNDSLSIPNFRKVTELAGWNADGWVYLSSVFLERNNFNEVVTILESALKVVPDDYRVNFFLGVAYSRLGRNEDAARVLERARELNADDVGVLSQLALVYDNMQRHDESDRLYEEALKKDPDNHLLLNNYSYSLSERRLQLDRALEMSRKAVEAQPKNSSYLDTLGWIFFQLGEYREAEEYISRAIEEGDVSAVVHEHLGDVYFMLQDRDRALEQWNIALRMDETNAELRAKIARGAL
jgi:tetratricopeptide (TPR) repeat protein